MRRFALPIKAKRLFSITKPLVVAVKKTLRRESLVLSGITITVLRTELRWNLECVRQWCFERASPSSR